MKRFFNWFLAFFGYYDEDECLELLCDLNE